MKSGLTKNLFFLLIIILPCFASAQDLHLSQYDADPLSLNPSLTGMFNGKNRIHAHYRTQWSSIATKPYLTTGLSYDASIKKMGIGVEIINNRSGAGNFNVFNALVSAAYDFSLDKKDKNHISVGIQGGIIQKSIDIEKLYFNTQYSPFNGGSWDQSLPSGENFTNTSILIPDVSAGITYYFASDKSRFNPFLGFSAFHLTQPEESFFARSNKLPMRYVIHSGFKFNINETVQLSPKFLYMKQENDQEITSSFIINYYLKDSETYLIFGPTYRFKDAAIVELGLKKEKFVYKLSYDINTSSLNPATSGRGGFEISVTYVSGKIKQKGIKTCPRL